MVGDVVDQVSINLPIHEDIKSFLDKDIMQQHHNKKQHSEKHHEQQMEAAYQMQWMQEEGCWQHIGKTKLQD